MKSINMRGRVELSQGLAVVCAFFALGVLPLACRNAFFDINRFKVELVLRAVPVLALAALLVFRARTRSVKAAHDPDVARVYHALLAFLAACAVSSAMRGFSMETLFGTDGRYCGLFFLLCSGAVFFIIARGALDGRGTADVAIFSAALIALLGVLNASGVDPLGFYRAMRLEQLTTFLSTIGNVDFFGAYLSMLYPLAAVRFVFAGGGKEKTIYGGCACLIACGVVVSRSDSAFFAMQSAALMLVSFAGDDYRKMGAAFLIWCASDAMLPLMRPLLADGKWMIPYTGIFAMLCDTDAIWMICAAMACATLLCFSAVRKGAAVPGRKKCLSLAAFSALILLTLIFGLSVYFTWIAPDMQLGAAADLLRIDAQWGTGRGMIYQGAAKAYLDFPIYQKLFGGGVDCARRILAPYLLDADSAVVFNDAHCHLLQFLLTTGAMGAAAYLGMYLLMLRACLRRSKDDPLLQGVFASLCGYAVISMLGVTQPIIIITYFSVAALAASRINALRRREIHEP